MNINNNSFDLFSDNNSISYDTQNYYPLYNFEETKEEENLNSNYNSIFAPKKIIDYDLYEQDYLSIQSNDNKLSPSDKVGRCDRIYSRN